MKTSHVLVCVLAACAAFQACADSSGPAEVENLLLAEWTGPYGGTPPFDKVQVADMQPALEQAMAKGAMARGGTQAVAHVTSRSRSSSSSGTGTW